MRLTGFSIKRVLRQSQGAHNVLGVVPVRGGGRWVCPQRELMAKTALGGALRGRKLIGPLPGHTTSHPNLRWVLKGQVPTLLTLHSESFPEGALSRIHFHSP